MSSCSEAIPLMNVKNWHVIILEPQDVACEELEPTGKRLGHW